MHEQTSTTKNMNDENVKKKEIINKREKSVYFMCQFGLF